ncbi:MAG: 30S ribosomal protein S20 [Candidatus Omnitrophica bacterium]|nr:30S ribosomal protein S20 [Candidatus Omnitrophota bacterium]
MPHRHNALKKLRQDKKRYLRNLKIKKDLKNKIKKFKKLLQEKKFEEAKNQLNIVYSCLDKASKKRIIHKNQADRKKSRLASLLSKTT